jgi:hypothetical protein
MKGVAINKGVAKNKGVAWYTSKVPRQADRTH